MPKISWYFKKACNFFDEESNEQCGENENIDLAKSDYCRVQQQRISRSTETTTRYEQNLKFFSDEKCHFCTDITEKIKKRTV